MKQKTFLFCIVISFLFLLPREIITSNKKTSAPKILHISFHLGCIQNFEDVAKEFSLDLTSWHIHSQKFLRTHFDGKTSNAAVYNIGHERAYNVWQKHKNYFEQFDAIVTSDTAPLSRIFLQNGWKKPLIIWVCNRFDYCDMASLDCRFPDKEYYDLFREATTLPHVRVIGYTPYEKFYAAQKGVDIGNLLIKPLGTLAWNIGAKSESFIPKEVNKQETVFVTPRLNPSQLHYVEQQCKKVGIKTYSGRYNGPDDLKAFRGVITIPYAWSTLAFFENIQNGLVHFIPSKNFVRELYKQGFAFQSFPLEHLELSEWYRPENRTAIVYFDSWEDLKQKIENTDYDTMKTTLASFSSSHRAEMLNRWHNVFEELGLLS